MLLGSHVSIAGGYMNALISAQQHGMDVIQIFTKNQRFWKEKIVTPAEGEEFRSQMKIYGVKVAGSHAIYLISLGAENEDIRAKSIIALAAELDRCKALGLTHTVVHPGVAGTLSEKEAINRISESVQEALKIAKKSDVKLLLENTAGQGTSIGGKIENLASLIDKINSRRVGICLDTCHAFAAGYDIRTEAGMKDLLERIDEEIGLEKLLCFHLNDSKGGLGSKLDRHTNIGEGLIGVEAFKYIMRYFPHIPKVTEINPEFGGYDLNLNLLRSLVK
jgi:deoxyribonuclease IV